MRHTATLAIAAIFALGHAATAWALCEAITDSPEAKLAPYGESFAFLAHQMDTRNWAGKDKTALRGHYSFKYSLCGDRYVQRESRKRSLASDEGELFLSYTGEFDFYLGTRTSDPVINRISNPALNLRVPLKRWYREADADDQLIISLEHRSDGQTTDATSDRGIEAAERAYQARDQAYFDSLSRSANYFGIALLSTNTRNLSQNLDLGLKLKLYFQQDTDVRWGPFLNRRRTIKDYDILQASFAWRSPIGWVDGNWTVGQAGAKASSASLGFQYDIWILPLYVRYHYGPMNTLSNYSQRQDSWGFWLRLARPFT